MSETPSPPPRPRWMRRLMCSVGGLLALLVGGYFVVTSAWFLKWQILPRVSQALGTVITVEDADIKPFSHVTLRGLKVQAGGTEPLLQATEVRARYHLRSLLAGRINVTELVVNSPVVNVAGNADGTFNFTPLVKADRSGSGTAKVKSAKPSGRPQLDVQSIAVNNATVRFTQPLRGEAGRQIELDARFEATGAWQNQQLDLRRFQLSLSPTARAQNQFQLTGKLDFSDTNTLAGALKLNADTLDLTPFYDLFDNPAKTNPPPPAAMPTDASTEAAAVKLAWRNTTLDVNIGRLFLREVAVSNFTAAARLDGSRVQLRPLQFVLNGAPVRAATDLNLGTAGWEYDVTLKADKIPIEPLVNSFSRNYKGQANGDLYADIEFKGAGTTGASLRRSLEGRAFLSFTNANIQIVGKKIRPLVSLIASALGTLDILQSPINHLTADLHVHAGKLAVRRFYAHSYAMIGETHGVIPLADALTNSPLQQPIEISLPRELAKRFSLTARTLDEGAYVKLPTFITLKGTLGKPDVDLDKFKLAEIGASRLVGTGAGVAVETVKGAAITVREFGKGLGKTLENIGDALLGRKPADTNAPAARETNQPPKFNPFKFLPPPKQP